MNHNRTTRLLIMAVLSFLSMATYLCMQWLSVRERILESEEPFLFDRDDLLLKTLVLIVDCFNRAAKRTSH